MQTWPHLRSATNNKKHHTKKQRKLKTKVNNDLMPQKQVHKFTHCYKTSNRTDT